MLGCSGVEWSHTALGVSPWAGCSWGMYVRVFGRHELELPPAWGGEVSVSVMGRTRIDATAEQGADAKLTVVAVLCDAEVLVPPGSTVYLSDGDILGSHRVEVESTVDGPSINTPGGPSVGKHQDRGRRLACLRCPLLGC